MKTEKIIKEQLDKILTNMEISFTEIEVDLDEDNEVYRININTDEPSLLIGHHGETIGALQHILKVLLWKDGGEQFNIMVDVDGYRYRQENSVMELVERKIEAAIDSGREQSLPPMSAYFRRIAHLYIAKNKEIESESFGEGDHRYVVIRVKK